jgi:hypothetical protein
MGRGGGGRLAVFRNFLSSLSSLKAWNINRLSHTYISNYNLLNILTFHLQNCLRRVKSLLHWNAYELYTTTHIFPSPPLVSADFLILIRKGRLAVLFLCVCPTNNFRIHGELSWNLAWASCQERPTHHQGLYFYFPSSAFMNMMAVQTFEMINIC